MVTLDTKISNRNSFVVQNNELQVVSTLNQKKKENNVSDKLLLGLPLTLLTTGGLLIYLGLKKPSINRVMSRVIKKHYAEMEVKTSEFIDLAQKKINEFFENSLEKIYNYKKDKVSYISEKLSPSFDKAENPRQIIKTQNLLFKTVDTEFNEVARAGLSEFGLFINELFIRVNKLKGQLGYQHWQTELQLQDAVNITSTSEYRKFIGEDRYSEALNQAQQILRDDVTKLVAQMNDYVDKETGHYVKLQSKIMANDITELRDLIFDCKKNIIDQAFKKMSEILKLEDFTPVNSREFTLESISNLQSFDLKPQKMPKVISAMFEGCEYWQAVENIDFNNLSDEIIKNIFYKNSPHYSLNDIGIMIDRIRLYEVANAQHSKLCKIAIAKLECLYVKLREFGESEFLSRSDQKFDISNPESIRAKIYYINDISRRLGYHTLTQANRNFIRNYPQYSKTKLCRCMDMIRQNPDMYFM
ncbi:hypothetical protein IJ579_02190 [bacterium]|nr:hypothetical protein [bacterium]